MAFFIYFPEKDSKNKRQHPGGVLPDSGWTESTPYVVPQAQQHRVRSKMLCASHWHLKKQRAAVLS
jgi:hypothetical protein